MSHPVSQDRPEPPPGCPAHNAVTPGGPSGFGQAAVPGGPDAAQPGAGQPGFRHARYGQTEFDHPGFGHPAVGGGPGPGAPGAVLGAPGLGGPEARPADPRDGDPRGAAVAGQRAPGGTARQPGFGPPRAPQSAFGPVPMYRADFAADPKAVYTRMREFGPFAPVELAPGVEAVLVTGYEAALHVLRSTEIFNKDARRWRAMNDGLVAPDSPVAGLMKYRPTTLWADGVEHRRLRSPIEESLARIDTNTLRGYVERSADAIIDRVGPTGRADLLTEYARELPVLVLVQLLGCTPDLGDRLHRSMSQLFDGIDSAGNHILMAQAVTDLIGLKRAQPGDDMVSRLLAHESALTDEELVHQIIMLFGAGTEPEQNLIANTLRLLLSDDRFAGSLHGGSMPIEDAIDEVLWTDPPMANYGVHYTFHDIEFEGTVLREGTPIVVSFAAASNDPALATDQRSGNRAHLAWSAGPHACPARREASIIATVAIERLLDRLPDMQLEVPVERLVWRPNPFHRALTSLPVRFPPETPVSASPLPPEDAAWKSGATGGQSAPAGHLPASVDWTPAAPRDTTPHRPGRPEQPGRLAKWWHGR